jgi:hypothetical protein
VQRKPAAQVACGLSGWQAVAWRDRDRTDETAGSRCAQCPLSFALRQRSRTRTEGPPSLLSAGSLDPSEALRRVRGESGRDGVLR